MVLLRETLAERLLAHGLAPTYWVAYSGGVDSHVLLHALSVLRTQYPLKLRAIHVNHGLSPHAAKWALHCRAVCESLQVHYEQYTVNAMAMTGESQEEVARQKRYAVLSAALAPQDVLLTAHHQDDQAETLLLQLCRGAGVKGLSAMPVQKPLGAGYLMRPLLAFTRAELLSYAKQHQLHWIHDESNDNKLFSRNFVRHAIFPQLKQRWPAIAATLSRTAQHCAEAQALIDEVAEQDLSCLHGQVPGTLSVTGLLALSTARQRHVLRLWLSQLGLPLPGVIKIQQLQRDMLHARPDKSPCIRWKGVEVRRYRDDLYAMPPLATVDQTQQWSWDSQQPLILPGLGELRALGEGQVFMVRFRQGGEKLQPAGRRGHHAVKKLLQEKGIPPWERDRIPLIYLGDQLVAVAGLWVDQAFFSSYQYTFSWCPEGQ